MGKGKSAGDEKEHEQDWLTTKELANRLNRSTETIKNWRKRGRGPKCFRTPKKFLYRIGDVEKWEKQNPQEDDPELLTTKQVAYRLKRPEVTLATWRAKGQGPEFIREGSRIFYRPEEVEKWMQETRKNWLTSTQVAKRLNRSPVTIRAWREKGVGPKFIRKGWRIFYRIEEVEKWAEKQEDDPELLTTKELANRLNRPAVTLGYWREKGVGPEYIRNSGRIFYRLEDVEKWEQEQEKEKKQLTATQVAKKLNMKLSEIISYRQKGKGPKPFKKGYRYFYRLEDVEEFRKNNWKKKDRLTSRQVSQRLHISMGMLSYFRGRGMPPECFRENGTILYHIREIEKWEEFQKTKKNMLTVQDLAKRWNRPVGTVEYWRKEGRGPEFIQDGQRYLYRIGDVEKWEKENPQETRENEQDWLTTKEVAKRLNRSEITIANWRKKESGPEFIEIDGRIFYRLEEVEKWVKEQETKNKNCDENWLTSMQVAYRLKRAPITLGYWRAIGRGPEYVKKKHRCLYRIEDVEKWEKEEEEKKDWLTTKQVADRLKRSIETIKNWRKEGRGPKCFRTPKKFLYRIEDVEKWAESLDRT